MYKVIIALEGIDGAGKSTLIKLLSNNLRYPFDVYNRTKKCRLINSIVTNRFFRKHYMLQVPIYVMLSHINYVKYFIKRKKHNILLMDRCFLSNICYFYPEALHNIQLFKNIMFFEPKLFPDKIFIFDIAPALGQSRDLNQKDIDWLINARNAYMQSKSSVLFHKFNIQIVDESLSLESKVHVITDFIERKLKDGY